MLLILALLRLALAAIFAIAGITKLRDQSGTREAVINFGAPKAAAPALAIILPVMELGIAVGLLFNISARFSATGAVLLLALFIIALSVNLARGETHDCHCFGQLYSRPIGWSTLARNFLFALAAGFVLWQGGFHADAGIVAVLRETVAGWTWVEWALLIAALLATAGLIISLAERAAKQVAPSVEGLPIGSVAPDFDLEAYEGGRCTLTQLLEAGKPLLLIFTSPNCPPCVLLFTEIGEWQQKHGERLTIALITRGTIKDNFVNVAKNRLGKVLLQGETKLAAKYHARGTPTALLIDPRGKVTTPIAGGREDIRKLLETFITKYPATSNEHGFVSDAVRMGPLNTPSMEQK